MIILAGDFNCRIDQFTNKSEFVLNFLQGEGLSLINDPQMKTYLCSNGSSTIDLIFTNMKGTKLINTRVRDDVVIRKHMPVEAEFEIEAGSDSPHIKNRIPLPEG